MAADKLVADFQRLLHSQAAGTEGAFFLHVMEAQAAQHFRLCAIPHLFDARVLQVLDPTLSEEQAHQRCEEFSRLSAVTPVSGSWAVHDKWRRELFAEWLRPENGVQFQAASRRLANYFKSQLDAETAGDAQETAMRRRMYHLIGADQAAGFEEFDRLFRRARNQFRLPESGALIRLAHDYDAVLAPERAAVLAYHEGKQLSDERDWKRAGELFIRVIGEPAAAPPLRAKSLVRLGHVLCEQGRPREAIEAYRKAREIADAVPEARKFTPRILHELGVAYRDLKELDRAEELFTESASRAAMQGGWGTYASAQNSLGRLHLSRREGLRAIDAFQTALEKLESVKDVLRASQVYNNIGLAYAELGDWEASESWFQKSLEVKRRSGDVMGQALALNNLSRVYINLQRSDQAIASAVQAAGYFEIVGDLGKAAIAKQNLAKHYRKLGNNDSARQALREAIDLFDRNGDPAGKKAAEEELRMLEAPSGVPWWAWLAVALVVLFIILVVVGLLVE